MKKLLKALALFALCTNTLAACQASPTGPVIPASRGAADRLAHRSVRHVLAEEPKGDAPGSAGIWGINCSLNETREEQHMVTSCLPSGCYHDMVWAAVTYVSFTTAGAGKFENLGNGRILYTVPKDRMLVVNEIGGGDVNIDGLSVGVGLTTHATANIPTNWGVQSQTVTDGRVTVNYVFGPGEQVVFVPSSHTTIAGYTADPALLGGKDLSPAPSK